jgi:hypothetical protein
MATLLSYNVNCNMSNIQHPPNHTPRISGGSINRAFTVKTAKVFRATLFLFGSEDGKAHHATETFCSPLSEVSCMI